MCIVDHYRPNFCRSTFHELKLCQLKHCFNENIRELNKKNGKPSESFVSKFKLCCSMLTGCPHYATTRWGCVHEEFVLRLVLCKQQMRDDCLVSATVYRSRTIYIDIDNISFFLISPR